MIRAGHVYAAPMDQRLIAHMTNGSSIEIVPSDEVDSSGAGWTDDLLASAVADPRRWPHKRWWRAADGSWINVRHVMRIEVEKAVAVRHDPFERDDERAIGYARLSSRAG
jgi:hypothetical protein